MNGRKDSEGKNDRTGIHRYLDQKLSAYPVFRTGRVPNYYRNNARCIRNEIRDCIREEKLYDTSIRGLFRVSSRALDKPHAVQKTKVTAN